MPGFVQMTRRVLATALCTVLLPVASAPAQAGGWQVTRSPNRGSRDDQLLGIAADATSDAWAVGNDNPGPYSNTLRTLAEHWNGTGWSVVSSPDPGNASSDYDSLNAVASIASNDAWAVGDSGNVSIAADQGLVERWNGTSWNIVASPNQHTSQDLYGVSASSASDAWAVGGYTNYAPYSYGAVIEHWKGSAWLATPNPGNATLRAVESIAANDVWAVGGSQILHWNGTSWVIVPSPQSPTGSYSLQSVAAAGPSDVWAVGYVELPAGEGYVYDTVIEHWNGSVWSTVPGVEPNPGSDFLYGVTAISPTDIVAVGGAGGLSFVESWNGRGWSRVGSPNVGTSNNTLLAAAALPVAGDVWAAGEYFKSKSPFAARTLVETCSGC
jgi:hypothetical protein